MQNKAESSNDLSNKKSIKSSKIISELTEPKTKLDKYNIHNTIVFFGSARIVPKDIAQKQLNAALKTECENTIQKAKNTLYISQYYKLATELAKKLALWAKNSKKPFHICTGGGGGIMEAANKGSYLANQPSIGFNIELPFETGANPYITKDLIFNFKYFFMRKFWLVYLAKAIIVFPGGFGTCDELFEILTLRQTKKLARSLPLVLFGTEFFNQILNTDIMLKYNLINSEDLNLFLITDNINEAFIYITNNIQPYTINDRL